MGNTKIKIKNKKQTLKKPTTKNPTKPQNVIGFFSISKFPVLMFFPSNKSAKPYISMTTRLIKKDRQEMGAPSFGNNKVLHDN